MKSLFGFLRTRYLRRRLEQPAIVIETPVPDTRVTVAFSVHTWFEYHNRARDSFVGEPDMVNWLKDSLRPGDVLWDVGANVGAFSILAAKLCPECRVYAFEPFIPTFAHLWENVLLNQVTAQVVPLCVGLISRTGMDWLAVSDPRAGSSQHQVGQGGGALRQGVIAARGADLESLAGIPAPTLLKVDIDGLEVAALEGLKGLLGRPGLRSAIIEVEAGRSEGAAVQLLAASGLQRVSNPLARPTGGSLNALFVRPE